MSKILVVEDSPMIQEILIERLLLRDYEVVAAKNGQEGIELAQKERPDLILMDISLPVWMVGKQPNVSETLIA